MLNETDPKYWSKVSSNVKHSHIDYKKKLKFQNIGSHLDMTKIGIVCSTGRIDSDLAKFIAQYRDLFEIYMPVKCLSYYAAKGIIADFYLSADVTRVDSFEIRQGSQHKGAKLLFATTGNPYTTSAWKGKIVYFSPLDETFETENTEETKFNEIKAKYFPTLGGMYFHMDEAIMLLKMMTSIMYYSKLAILGFNNFDFGTEKSLSNLNSGELIRYNTLNELYFGNRMYNLSSGLLEMESEAVAFQTMVAETVLEEKGEEDER